MSSPELFPCRFHIVYEDIKEYKNQLAKPRDDHCVVLLYILFVLHYLLTSIIIVSCSKLIEFKIYSKYRILKRNVPSIII